MDIRKFSVVQCGRLHLRDAADAPMYADGDDGKPDLGKPLVVHVFGPGSKEFARAENAQSNRMLETYKRIGKSVLSAEQKALVATEFLTDCTDRFEHLEYDGLSGAELARAVYGDRSIGFIADQVAKFLGDWGNFTKGSTPS